jgi:hypothetical protein
MSLTDSSTAAGAKTRSIHPSRNITGLALSIACRAPSENFPSGKIPKAIASSMLRCADSLVPNQHGGRQQDDQRRGLVHDAFHYASVAELGLGPGGGGELKPMIQEKTSPSMA